MRLFPRGLRSRFLLTIGATALAAVLAAPVASAAPGDQLRRASTKSDGSETASPCLVIIVIKTGACNSFEAGSPSLSADGRYVAFVSNSPDQIPGAAAPSYSLFPTKVDHVFRKDMQTGQVVQVDIKDNGNPIPEATGQPAISADGNFVVFTAKSDQVSVRDSAFSNGRSAIYMRDIGAGRTTAISDPNGAVRVFGLSLSFSFLGSASVSTDGSFNPQISADGNTVTFQSNDSQVNAGATHGSGVGQENCENGNLFFNCPVNTYVWSRNPSATRFPWGTMKAIENLADGKLSTNGQWLLSNKGGNIVRTDTATLAQTTMVDKAGLLGPIHAGTISDDGNTVAFWSEAPNLVPGDNNQVSDVFVKTGGPFGTVKRLSVSPTGQEFPKASTGGSVSGDGKFVSFNSLAPLTTAANTWNVYVSDVIIARPKLVSVSRDGGQGSGTGPVMGTDGRFIAFVSAGALTVDKNNQNTEVYVYDRNGVPLPQAAGPVWLAAADGGVFAYGGAQFYGSMGGTRLNQPVTGIGTTPDQGGYWLTASDGGIFSFGNAQFFGSMGGTPLNKPVVSIAATPTGQGYWEVASDGGIFTFGDAEFFGSMGGTPLNKPIVGIASTPSGKGYYLVASDGGIFAFGDAVFYGSTGNLNLLKPINGIKVTPSGKGYFLVASDGGLFAFGDAEFLGSAGGSTDTYVGMTILDNNQGYRLIDSQGTMVLFHKNAVSVGGKRQEAGTKLNKPVVGVSS
ncbi:MAG: hypothetical protein U0V73_01455 [Acidimicrobiia bacterium]